MKNVLYLLLAVASILSLNSCKKDTPGNINTAADLTVVVDSISSEDNVMIYYDVRGDNPKTLVFVHCWSCDRSYWSEQVEVFSKDYRVVTIDLGGHGESGMEREEWTIASFGADVASVANRLGLDDIILVGHSMGGPVTLEAARLLKERITAIIGVDVFQNLKRTFVKSQIEHMMTPFDSNFISSTKDFVRNTFPEGADSNLVNKITEDMSSAPPEVGISAIRNTLSYNYHDVLKEVRVPIRCINSDRYPTNIEDNRKLTETFDVKIMEGRGHFLQLEDPQTFNKLLQSTISEFWQ